MTERSIPQIPAKYPRGVILKWNLQPNLAAVPESAIPKESRHAIAALKTMTNPKAPNWEGALAIICVAIENYAEIRGNPNRYEYVKDLTLSQFLMWELARFLDVNQPRIRLRKDKSRLPEHTDEVIEQRRRRQLAKRYNTDSPVELNCLRHADKQDSAERCCECKYEAETLVCGHPQWPHITKAYMDDCFSPKEN